MARHAHKRRAGATTAIATRPQLVVIRGGGGGRRRRAGGRVRTIVRRAGRGAKKGLPATGLAIGGLIVGYAQGSGWFNNLPSLGGDQTLALGIAGYAATRMTSNKYIREAGAAAIAVAAFETGRQHAVKSGGGKPAVHGAGPGGGGVGPWGGA